MLELLEERICMVYGSVQNINPQPGPQLKHILFCTTNPAKFWWSNFQWDRNPSSPQATIRIWLPPYCKRIRVQVRTRDHSNSAGFVLQFKMCPVRWDVIDSESPRSWVRVPLRSTSPSHFLMTKTRFKLQHKSSQILVIKTRFKLQCQSGQILMVNLTASAVVGK